MAPRDEPRAATPSGGTDVTYASVLVPLDGSDLAERALVPGRALATRFGAELHVVAGAVRRDERWWFTSYLDDLRQRGVTATEHVSDDPHAPTGIVTAARTIEPCLVCIATHGRARSAAVVGSTFTAVAARLRAPLVAVGPRAGWAESDGAVLDRVVVCLDGEAHAERSLPIAAGWARRFGLPLSLVTAADPLLLRSRLGRERVAETCHFPPDGDPRAYLEALAAGAVFAGLVVETEVLWGPASPHVTIGGHLDRHPGALAVATTHARTGLRRVAHGSSMSHIVHRSPVPVLAVPPLVQDHTKAGTP
jgi:nucleotide-binding universal stress UspA family protein